MVDAIFSCLGCASLSLLFVFSLYVADSGLPRSHPKTVRRRIWAACTVCIVGPSVLYFALSIFEQLSFSSFLALLGVRWSGLFAAVVCPCILVLLLYTGCFLQIFLDGSNFFHALERKDLLLRNFVVAPFAEELIFRACMLVLLSPAFGRYKAIFICPLFFGLAHSHHLVEWYRANNDATFLQACATVLMQISYTSVFGLFAAFVFARSQHLVGIVLSHSLCNLMGLPPIEDALHHPRKWLIITSYLVGFLLFFVLLFPLTEPSLFVD